MNTLLYRSLAGVLMVGAMSLGLVSAGHADTITTYTFNNAGGLAGNTGPFGTVTVDDNGAGTDIVTVNMSPNNLLGTGSHHAFTFEMAAGATISPLTGQNAGFSILDNGTSTVDNDPFHGFNYAIDCSTNPTGGCGSTLTFTITGATAFLNNTGNGGPVLFAADIFCGGCVGTAKTGVVGVSAVPGPIVGAGLPGLIAACAGLVGFARRRRRSLA